VTGTTGPTGSPWTAGGTLPVGSTETGAWAIGPANIKPSESFLVSYARTAISFPIPLAAALPAAKAQSNPVGFPLPGSTATEKENCPGSAADPKAKSGFLCLYTTVLQNNSVGFAPKPVVYKVSSTEVFPTSAEGADRVGAGVAIGGNEENPSRPFGWGTWAVTG
jgi:hypothetical protein